MIHMVDSEIFGRIWSSEEMRQLFDEPARLRGWLLVMSKLAEAQAELGIIPIEAAHEIVRACAEDIDVEAVKRGYQETGHSLLGLIRERMPHCAGEAGEWLCFGATVQDITDTWLAVSLLRASDIIERDLRQTLDVLATLAERHVDTLTSGRTHGQQGLPITFGFKVAVWMMELDRHLQRLREVRTRLGEGQLAGGAGTLSAFGSVGFALQERFFAKLGLRAPVISWCTSRDVLAEWMQTNALIASTFDKIGHEVYNLQRTEIGELREGASSANVGSITMPHKRNPEMAEHLGTLARLIRHHAQAFAENLVQEHERDGRSWKAEWALIPPAMAMMGALLQLGQQLCAGLEVNADRMRENVEQTGGLVYSETLMLRLARRIGKQSAHRLVHRVAGRAAEQGQTFQAAVRQDATIREHLSAEELDAWCTDQEAVRTSRQFVLRVLDQVRARSASLL